MDAFNLIICSLTPQNTAGGKENDVVVGSGYFFFPFSLNARHVWRTDKTHCWVLFQIMKKCVAKCMSLNGSWEA